MKRNALKKGLVLALVLGLIGGGITLFSGSDGIDPPTASNNSNIVENC